MSIQEISSASSDVEMIEQESDELDTTSEMMESDSGTESEPETGSESESDSEDQDPTLLLAEILSGTLENDSGDNVCSMLVDIRDQLKIHNKLLAKITMKYCERNEKTN